MLGKVFKVFEIGRFGSIFNKRIYHFSSSFPKFDASKDYYDILKVTKESSESEIKISYYQLAKEYHPDANPGK
jgi:DnaJ-domain-containing protein 1